MGCGTCANEFAFKTVFRAFMNRQRLSRHFSLENINTEEIYDSNENRGPAKNLSILAFRGGLHGRTVGAISCTNSFSRIKVCSVKLPKTNNYFLKIFQNYSFSRIL